MLTLYIITCSSALVMFNFDSMHSCCQSTTALYLPQNETSQFLSQFVYVTDMHL